jgi:hypothetical protein
MKQRSSEAFGICSELWGHFANISAVDPQISLDAAF